MEYRHSEDKNAWNADLMLQFPLQFWAHSCTVRLLLCQIRIHETKNIEQGSCLIITNNLYIDTEIKMMRSILALFLVFVATAVAFYAPGEN